MSHEVLQQALDALENHSGNYKLTGAECDTQEAVLTAIKEVLAKQDAEAHLQAISDFGQEQEQEQEPVAWMHTQLSDVAITHRPADLECHPDRWIALYTSPPQREWVGLTEVEVGDLFDFAYANDREFVLNVEAKLKEKNT